MMRGIMSVLLFMCAPSPVARNAHKQHLVAHVRCTTHSKNVEKNVARRLRTQINVQNRIGAISFPEERDLGLFARAASH